MQANSATSLAGATTNPDAPWHTIPVPFDAVPDFETADLRMAWLAFHEASRAIVEDAPALRLGTPASTGLKSVCRKAIAAGDALGIDDIRSFLRANFEPHLICRDGREVDAFLTGYYRPEVAASRRRTSACREPLLGRPSDLVTLLSGEMSSLPPGFSAGRRLASGDLEVYPSRADIDAGALAGLATPIAYVRDAVEAFLIQVQGSARLRFDDGTCTDLTYAGRNGHPYSSIGKRLVADGEVPASEISMDRLKAWVRRHGQEAGERGRMLLHTNPSYVFFSEAPVDDEAPGPVGASGVPLRPLTSIAVDRSIWSYSLPFWIVADLPWEGPLATRFSALALAQDTGSAIVGPARADLYFGSGDEAGRLAGDIRHTGRMFVFLPRQAT